MPGLRERLGRWLLRTSPATPDSWLVAALGGGSTTAAGVNVDAQTAMCAGAVYACVRLLSETIASLPLALYRMEDRGKTLAKDHPLYPVLRWQANPEMTAFAWREVSQAHLALWGNAYSQIVRNGAGQVKELWPLRPDKIKVHRHAPTAPLTYELSRGNGSSITYPADEILHIAGISFDGLVGLSPIGLMRQAVGLSIAAETYGAGFFGNSADPGGVLQHPGKLSDEAHQRLRRSWEERHRGPGNAGRVALLEEGMTYQQIGLPPEDAQFLETRRFQVTDIARWFRIPPHMVGDLDRATFSNIEQQSIEFVTYTLVPWLERWVHSIALKLLAPKERLTLAPAFNTSSLLRGDTAARYVAYATARQWGWMSANDVREAEGDNPVEGGDVYLVPLNMVPADEPRPQPQPKAGADAGTQPPPKTPPAGRAEDRSRRSAAARRRLAEAYMHPIESAAARIVRREVTDVSEAARKHLVGLGRAASSQPQQVADFVAWLEAYYGGERTAYIRDYLAPTLAAYAEAVNAESADELGGDPKQTLDQVHTFAGAYADSFADRYVESSLGQLRAVAQDAATAGADPLQAVQERLQQWQERRPGKVSTRESYQAGNAVAKTVFATLGVRKLRWDATGSACPYCATMDGQVVGIEDVFVPAGGAIQSDDPDDEPMTTYFSLGHPPAHRACRCVIQPVP